MDDRGGSIIWTIWHGYPLPSASGRYAAAITEDGRLQVVLQPNRLNREPVVVREIAAGRPGAQLRLQVDGNLVLYDPEGAVATNYGTVGSGAMAIVMQDDRNLVVYACDNRPVLSLSSPVLPTLVPGQALLSGDSLLSEDGSTLVMQGDGNLVLYQGGQARFQSGTNSPANAGADAVLQPDGNLVVVAGSRVVFESGTGTAGPGARTTLRLADGAFRILRHPGNGTEVPVYGSAWATAAVAPGQTLLHGESRRSADGRSVLRFQVDGNLVLYRDGQPTFRTGTQGTGAVVAAMQSDGNLVLYRPSAAGPEVVFQTRTAGNPGAQLVITDDGSTVVVRSRSGSVLFPR
ncbi:hypothetical protein [Aquipuribacter hungaricus]|uniref:Bulb-type lectin domain-containing protein n=1 Tax=Aquipuribacter hungaricus TaxID=545624 RepID=A0ABV7WGN0_9MICO